MTFEFVFTALFNITIGDVGCIPTITADHAVNSPCSF